MARKQNIIEKENRTTITGIVAIVLIVFLIASFMRINEIGPFTTERENVRGSATESFIGVRHVQLAEHEALVGHLSVQGLGKRTYYVYPDDNILVVDYGSRHTQTILVEDAEAPGIYSGVYSDRATAHVLVNTLTAQLYVDGLTEMPLPPIAITPLRVFDGELSVAGAQYYFRLIGDELLITSADTEATVYLTERNGLSVGSWEGRSVTVNAAERIIIIDDFY